MKKCGTRQLQLVAEQFDVAPFSDSIPLQPSGHVNLSLNLSAAQHDYDLSARCSVTDLHLNNQPLGELDGDLTHRDGRTDLNLRLRMDQASALVFNARTDSLFRADTFQPLQHPNIRFSLSSQSAQLNLLQPFVPAIQNASGALQIDLESDDLMTPGEWNGRIQIENGKLGLVSLNTPLKNIQLNAVVDSVLTLQRLHIQSPTGKLNLNGRVALGDRAQPVRSFYFRTQSEQFSVSRGSDMDLTLDSDLIVEGTPDAPRFSGTLGVRKGRLILQKHKAVQTRPDPLLVQTSEPQESPGAASRTRQPLFLQSLRGQTRISITATPGSEART
ncbi:MAG: translocation/assembly module TamB domain-containing protein [candidate division KSB1 bacterium]|nr:translocation/assembly module TamB domain-containing protein [candidate division KSB1 bacterium]